MSKIRLHGSSSGYVEIAPAATASNNTLTAPSTVGEIIAKDAAGAIGVTSVHTTNVVVTGTTKVGAAVTISESGIEASGIGITVANINGGKVGGRKNLMINGSMIISQRYLSSSVTSVTGHIIDRFLIGENGLDEQPTKQQVGITTGSAPHRLGFGKALKITNGNQTGGAGATDYMYLRYKWEGQEIVTSGWDYIDPNSFITLSFWIKSSVAQSFQFYFRTVQGTLYNYTFESGSLTADTWTKVIKTIPGNSNLAFNHDNLEGFLLVMGPFWGTDYTTASSTMETWRAYDTANRMKDNDSTWYTTNDATFEVTGFQLEVGTQATPFEHRGENEELALCQRYCYVIHMQNGDNAGIVGQVLNTNTARGIIHFPQPMRTEPSYTGSATICRYEAADSSDDFNFSGLVLHRTPEQRPVSYTGLNQGLAASSMSGGQAFLVIARANSGKMIFDAEV